MYYGGAITVPHGGSVIICIATNRTRIEYYSPAGNWVEDFEPTTAGSGFDNDLRRAITFTAVLRPEPEYDDPPEFPYNAHVWTVARLPPIWMPLVRHWPQARAPPVRLPPDGGAGRRELGRPESTRGISLMEASERKELEDEPIPDQAVRSVALIAASLYFMNYTGREKDAVLRAADVFAQWIKTGTTPFERRGY